MLSLMVGLSPGVEVQESDDDRVERLVEELSLEDARRQQRARLALVEMGRRVVPALVEEVGSLRDVAPAVLEVLAQMGEEAEEALPLFVELCEARGDDPWPETLRVCFLDRAAGLEWAAEDLLPAVEALVFDDGRPDDTRRSALNALAAMGEGAIEVLRAAGDRLPLLRVDAYTRLARLHAELGTREPADFWEEVILADPLAAEVRLTLVQAAREGGREFLAAIRRVKAAMRRELEARPSAALAMQLALIVQDQLLGCDLSWESPADGGPLRAARVDSTADYRVMSELVAQAFSLAERESEEWREIGVGLAKLFLLRGDWDAMDAVLAELGTPRAEVEDLSSLTAPPKDWSELSTSWGPCAEAMRGGTSVAHFRVECQGRGVRGAQVLLREAPPPPAGQVRIFKTGWRVDTLTFGSQPFTGVWDFAGSWGYLGGDRAGTRYAVTDSEGRVSFASLPAKRLRVQVLIPAGSIDAPATSWEMVLVGEDGAEHPGGSIGVAGEDPARPLLLHPGEGEEVHYPTIRLRPSFDWNVEPWEAVDPEQFTLQWPPVEGADVRYEVELKLSCPHESLHSVSLADVLCSATVETREPRWPLGSAGVGGVELVPGNVYILRVTARDASGEELARYGDTMVWVPWAHREARRPRCADAESSPASWASPPVGERTWWRGSIRYGDGREESLREKVARHAAAYSENFEWEYVRVIDAWLTWGIDGDFPKARIQLEELSAELPVGCVPRSTAEWLMRQMDAGAKFERALHLQGSLD